MELMLKLVLAHFIGDFVLQPSQWVSDKKKRKLKSKYLYIHSLIHFSLLLIILQFQKKYLLAILIISVSHFIIDALKLHFERKKYAKLYFALDQILHLTVIWLVVNYFYPFSFKLSEAAQTKLLLLLTSLVFVTYVTAVILKISLSNLNPEKKEKSNNAGKYIGILERLFVFLFIAINFWEGIGFLLAAKSIFRFGDLREKRDIRLTEYILIGTLMSFGLAILTGLAYNYLMKFL